MDDAYKYVVNELNEIQFKIDKYFQLKQQSYFYLIAYLLVINFVLYYLYYQVYLNIKTDLWTSFMKCLFALIRKIPYVKNRIRNELNDIRTTLESEIKKTNKSNNFIKELPKNGLSEKELMVKLNEYLKMEDDQKWKNGACSGCVYGADDSLTELNTNVYKKFAWTNVMHADVFPDVRKMEAEVVRMVCRMFNGDDETCGTMSSGGTESIMLACKAYRDLAYSRGVQKPEMVIPESAHAAFVKAGQFFNIKVNLIKIDEKSKQVNLNSMKRAINSNTCMLVGSAPNFPYGIIDPISEISKLGCKYNIPVHVDACLGGFIITFINSELPVFDFRLPGVTSISCDTHKYGYTPKGSSVILYRNRTYRQRQYFAFTEWQGGIYCSPTFAGSRAGSIIAMTWSTMMHFGFNGYIKASNDVMKVTRYVLAELRKIKEIEIMGDPTVTVIAFTSSQFNIYRLLDELKDWHLNAIQNPSGIHIAFTKMHTQPGVAERFVNDVRTSVQNIMKQEDRQLGKIAQIYCSSQSVQDRSIIEDVSYLYLDVCYDTNIQ